MRCWDPADATDGAALQHKTGTTTVADAFCAALLWLLSHLLQFVTIGSITISSLQSLATMYLLPLATWLLLRLAYCFFSPLLLSRSDSYQPQYRTINLLVAHQLYYCRSTCGLYIHTICSYNRLYRSHFVLPQLKPTSSFGNFMVQAYNYLQKPTPILSQYSVSSQNGHSTG